MSSDSLLPFSKMHGLGNDFAVMESITQPLPLSLSSEKVKAMADRRLGIGFDQLLLLQPASDEHCDFDYRIFNADGGEVGQCGNGARCVHAFLLKKKLTDKWQLVLKTTTTYLRTQMMDAGRIRVNMPPARFLPGWSFSGFNFEHIEIGNPHCICFDENIGKKRLVHIGRQLNETMENGINVGFATVNADGIRLKVYERGAGLTAACGSAALAAAVAAIKREKSANPVSVNMPGGKLLCGVNSDSSIWLEGESVHVYDGVLSLNRL